MHANVPDKPIPDFRKQFEGKTRCYDLDQRLQTCADMFRFCQLMTKPVHAPIEHLTTLNRAHDSFSMMGKR